MDKNKKSPGVSDKALLHQSNKKIFIGIDFQATLPPQLMPSERAYYEQNTKPHATMLWKPSDLVTDDQLDALVAELKLKGLTEDQILPFLCHSKYDIDATLFALKNTYVGRSEGMPLHDKVMFNQGYGFHGKNFDRIAELLPHHSLQTLIAHYYTEFKRNKQSKLSIIRPETEVRRVAKDASDILTNRNKLALANGTKIQKSVQELSISSFSGSSESAAVYLKDRDAQSGAESLSKASFILPEEDMLSTDAPKKLDERMAEEKSRLEKSVTKKEAAIDELKKAIDALPLSSRDLLHSTAVLSAKMDCKKTPTAYWDQEEISCFMRALVEFGTEFTKASHLFPHKTEQQLRNMFYNRQHFYGLDKLILYHEEKVRARQADAAAKSGASSS